MSLLRRRMMMQKDDKLTPPQGYSFIEFTKKAYDTGIIPNDKIVEIDFRCTGKYNYWQVFGLNNQYLLMQNLGSSGFLGFLQSRSYFSGITTDVNARHVCIFDPVSREVWIDDDYVDTPSTTPGISTVSFWINGVRKSDGSGFWNYGAAGIRNNEIYSLKVYDGVDNSLILYALPVKNNATNEEAMYDFVNNRFLEVIQ